MELSRAPDNAPIRTYSKKMVATLSRELTKIRRNLQGIRDMKKTPQALIVVDPKREHIAVKEAQRMGIAVVALIDTDSDPDTVDLPIPGNDDSIRSIELIVSKMADAVLEGRAALPPEAQGVANPASRPRGPGANQPQRPQMPQNPNGAPSNAPTSNAPTNGAAETMPESEPVANDSNPDADAPVPE